jgi:hypothetical protein
MLNNRRILMWPKTNMMVVCYNFFSNWSTLLYYGNTYHTSLLYDAVVLVLLALLILSHMYECGTCDYTLQVTETHRLVSSATVFTFYLWVLHPVAHPTGSLWCRQSQQSFSTSTPLFIFPSHSLHEDAWWSGGVGPSFLILALDGSGWSVSCHDHFTLM